MVGVNGALTSVSSDNTGVALVTPCLNGKGFLILSRDNPVATSCNITFTDTAQTATFQLFVTKERGDGQININTYGGTTSGTA